MIEFLKKRFGYGLAGFFVGIFLVVTCAKVFSVQDIPGQYLWAAPAGFFIGLFFPQIIRPLFMGALSSANKTGVSLNDVNELDEVQKGPLVVIVKVFGVVFLLFLIWLVYIMAKDTIK